MSLIAVLLMASAATPAAHYTEADFARVAKFDSHFHANVEDPRFLALAKRDRFEVLSINVDYPDFPPSRRGTSACSANASRASRPTHACR